MAQCLFKTGKVGCFVDTYTPGIEKRRGEDVSVLRVKFRVQPFDSKLAAQVRHDVRTTLFKLNAPNEPQAHLSRVNFALLLVILALQLYRIGRR